MKILVLGKNGQLGKTILAHLSNKHIDINALTSSDLNFLDEDFDKKLSQLDFDILINAAAFHNLDEAELDPLKSFLINSLSLKKIAKVCKEKKAILFHFSTDYIFSGSSKIPYEEDFEASPLNIYGHTKLLGETLVQSSFDSYFIFRVSSLFSPYNASNKKNFIDAIVEKAKKNEELKIVSNQIMSPTSTNLISSTVNYFIENLPPFGIYHLRNKDEISWYDYGKNILNYLNIKTKIIPTNYSDMNFKVQRPLYSVMNINKIENCLGHIIDSYENDLYDYLKNRFL